MSRRSNNIIGGSIQEDIKKHKRVSFVAKIPSFYIKKGGLSL